jgi:hypothetical protein
MWHNYHSEDNAAYVDADIMIIMIFIIKPLNKDSPHSCHYLQTR